MKPPAFSLRTLFIAAVTAIVILSVTGWTLWELAATQFRGVIDGWITDGRAQGYQISYDDRQIFGFPHRITMRLTNLHWRTADNIDFRTDDMDIQVTPWDWSHYQAKFKNTATITAPTDDVGHALILAAASGRAEVELTSEGLWRHSALFLNNAQWGLTPNYVFQAETLNATMARPDTPPADHGQPGLSLSGEADIITVPPAMPSPFGNKATRLAAQMRVMGRVPDLRHRAAVDAWNKDSGIVEFDDLTINWGTLDIASKGAVGFDDDLQPEGAFAGTVAQPEATMKALMEGGFIATHDAGMLSSAMHLFAKPPATGGNGMEFPITVQMGGFFFGPVRIFTFPAIEWPVEPAAGSPPR